jgi:Rps23 Pro-64 3,4-dihydroxylase Tpa1-like proline 4-hydroxylase
MNATQTKQNWIYKQHEIIEGVFLTATQISANTTHCTVVFDDTINETLKTIIADTFNPNTFNIRLTKETIYILTDNIKRLYKISNIVEEMSEFLLKREIDNVVYKLQKLIIK